MLRRVDFIGSGYEVVRFVMVDTDTTAEAIEAAKKWYEESSQDFHYIGMEIPKEYAYNESKGGNLSVDEMLADACSREVVAAGTADKHDFEREV